MSGPGRSGLGALLRLGAGIASGRLARPRGFDQGRVVCRWAQGVLPPGGERGYPFRVGRRSFVLVGPGDRSRTILEGCPATDGARPGAMKRKGMSFLAPGAVTIAHGEDWARLRPFHERVLEFDEGHPLEQEFLRCVRLAFDHPIRSMDEVRTAMGRAMLAIVLGEKGVVDAGLPEDVHALFEAVQSPVRRKLFGSRYRERRERLYIRLSERWDETSPDDPTLLGLARRHAPADVEPGNRAEILQQFPHWMFTFTGSGTDLLTRTLAMITSRPAVYVRVREELASAGPPDRAQTVWGLRYVPACLLETGRLFPPVTRVLHRGPAAEAPGGAESEIIHYLPLFHRHEALGPSAHEFHPERWFGSKQDPAATGALTFLHGPRSCPGRTLILFICAAALARQLGEGGMEVRTTRLSRDPLPVDFPSGRPRFNPRRAS